MAYFGGLISLPRIKDRTASMSTVDEPAREIAVPTPEAIVDLRMSDGAPIRLRRYGNGPVRLLLSHGNGLAINAYTPFWEPLIDDFELVVFDIRNHGENPLHDPQQHNWPRITQDIGEIFAGTQRQFGEKPTVGAFHSLSAVATLLNAVAGGPAWHALVLFDPPIFPPAGHPVQPAQIADMEDLTRRATGRPVAYRSPEQFAAQLLKRRAFSRWVPGAHLLFAQSTLRPGPNGEWILCCPRELEAHMFATNNDPTLWAKLPSITIPMMIIGADADDPNAGPPARISRAIHEDFGIAYAGIPNTTHFLQTEQPAACREVLRGFLQR
jgi:pimeloyl-ACP methyl ester carboxylesterase